MVTVYVCWRCARRPWWRQMARLLDHLNAKHPGWGEEEG